MKEDKYISLLNTCLTSMWHLPNKYLPDPKLLFIFKHAIFHLPTLSVKSKVLTSNLCFVPLRTEGAFIGETHCCFAEIPSAMLNGLHNNKGRF